MEHKLPHNKRKVMLLTLYYSMETKCCTKCKRVLPITDFYKCNRTKSGLQFRCKQCTNEWQKEFRHSLTPEQRKRYNGYSHKYKDTHPGKHSEDAAKRNLRDKKEVFSHYENGEIKCRRCGITDIRCLTLDHINGGGAQHRKQIGQGVRVYKWARHNNYPPIFQVLCMNCQFIKRSENKEWGKYATMG
jgi:hypothetical protein